MSTYSAHVGDVHAVLCLEGYGLASGSCYPCPAGTYAEDGSFSSCTYCPAGTYLPSIGNN